VQRGGVGDAVGTEYNRLTVDHQILLAQLQRGLDDQWEVRRPIIAATPGDPAHAVLLIW
jgi:hypothetical protein